MYIKLYKIFLLQTINRLVGDILNVIKFLYIDMLTKQKIIKYVQRVRESQVVQMLYHPYIRKILDGNKIITADRDNFISHNVDMAYTYHKTVEFFNTHQKNVIVIRYAVDLLGWKEDTCLKAIHDCLQSNQHYIILVSILRCKDVVNKILTIINNPHIIVVYVEK
jgi:hypothetical protein